MISSPRANGAGDLFNSNHNITLITQAILGARSRKKNQADSVTDSRRTSFNDSPGLVLPNNQVIFFSFVFSSNFLF